MATSSTSSKHKYIFRLIPTSISKSFSSSITKSITKSTCISDKVDLIPDNVLNDVDIPKDIISPSILNNIEINPHNNILKTFDPVK